MDLRLVHRDALDNKSFSCLQNNSSASCARMEALSVALTQLPRREAIQSPSVRYDCVKYGDGTLTDKVAPLYASLPPASLGTFSRESTRGVERYATICRLLQTMQGDLKVRQALPHQKHFYFYLKKISNDLTTN
jgi:hypothetical protein